MAKNSVQFPPESIPMIRAAAAIAGTGPPVRGVPGGVCSIGPKGLMVLGPDYLSMLVIRPAGLERHGVVLPGTRQTVPLGDVVTLIGTGTVAVSCQGTTITTSVNGTKQKRRITDPGNLQIFMRSPGNRTDVRFRYSDIARLGNGSALAGSDWRHWSASVAVGFGPEITACSSDRTQIRRDGPILESARPIISLGLGGVSRGVAALKVLMESGDTADVSVPDETGRDAAISTSEWTLWLRTSEPIPDQVLNELPSQGIGTGIAISDLIRSLGTVHGLDHGAVSWIGDRFVAADDAVSVAVPAPCHVPGGVPISFPCEAIRSALADWSADTDTVALRIRSRGKTPSKLVICSGTGSGAIVTMVTEPTPEQRLAASDMGRV